MMKRKYDAPEMSAINLQATDVITTSTGAFDGEWVTLGAVAPNSHKI